MPAMRSAVDHHPAALVELHAGAFGQQTLGGGATADSCATACDKIVSCSFIETSFP